MNFSLRFRGSLRQIRLLLGISLAMVSFSSLIVYPSLLPSKHHEDILGNHHVGRQRSYRIDEVFPPILRNVTLQLPSIPAENRLPVEVSSSNVTEFFSISKNIFPQKLYFFDYNPSIIKLPNNQKLVKGAVYLASFRVSNSNYCFHPGKRSNHG